MIKIAKRAILAPLFLAVLYLSAFAAELTPGMRIISSPGVYVATQDLAYFDGDYGLQIVVDDVYINFNGHYFGNNGQVAVYANGRRGITIASGHLWGGSIYGIRLEGAGVSNNRVTSMEVYGTTTVGIAVDGNGIIVDNSNVHTIGNGIATRALGIIVNGNGANIAYNNVYGMRGRFEGVPYSDVGDGNNVYGNTFSNMGAVDCFTYFIWANGSYDVISGNTFLGQYSEAALGIIGADGDMYSMSNSVTGLTTEEFYATDENILNRTGDTFH